MNADPEQTLQEVADSFDLSRTSIKTILNNNKMTYHKKISTPPFLQHHKNDRINMCTNVTSIPYNSLLPIVFTDESAIVEILINGSGNRYINKSWTKIDLATGWS